MTIEQLILADKDNQRPLKAISKCESDSKTSRMNSDTERFGMDDDSDSDGNVVSPSSHF